MPRPGKHDPLFGGQPGAAQRALERMKRTYGNEKGQTVFDATVIKRQRKGKGKRSLARRLLG